jgi:flagellin
MLRNAHREAVDLVKAKKHRGLGAHTGIRTERFPMALGVLNNLSAIYAENNLNNTNSSLQQVLQQLSSGSRINSGADDAAGLSLVNGLAANSAALTQSETNATEGVGLLQVADGALSQVTNLLNRAITLATEASNGTLNSTQEGAANQEYQSILAEVNNIGQTTTYNQEQVFDGNIVAIYTGDSSTAGSSVDDLNIRTLSQASVGDTGGAMAYSDGSNNVFIDLSTAASGTGLATANDALASPTTTIDVNYLVAGPNDTTVVTPTTISVGVGQASTNDTAQGLINAINNSGLGLTATFTTGKAAGDSAAGLESGIEITSTGAGVGNGVTPGLVGSLTDTGTAFGGGDVLTGTLTIKGADGGTSTINLTNGNGGTNYTISTLMTAINNGGYGITASIGANAGSLTFTSADPSVSITGTGVASTTLNATTNFVASPGYYSVGITNSGLGTPDAAPDVADFATGQSSVAPAPFAGDTGGTGGTATMSYTDGPGQALNTTDLKNQADAEAALNMLNVAISDVAAQDGYIGAQINTLNSISQVMSTQQENVVSAQNAVQATDYASATSNMSKYEILSQTGIAALAQANQVQQEVTKLLQ